MPIFANQEDVKVTDHTASGNPNNKFRWWDLGDQTIKQLDDADNLDARKRLANDVFLTAEQIFTNMRETRLLHYYFSLMYHDMDYGGRHTPQLTNFNYDTTSMGSQNETGATLNVVQSAIDTAAAMISKNKPKPLFITSGAKDNELKIQAELLTKFVQGVYDENDVYNKGQEMFTEACISGTGALRVCTDLDTKKIKVEWIFSEELLVDDIDGRDKCPTQLHYKHYYSRDYLIAKYPDYKDAILTSTDTIVGSAAYRSVADVIPVVESWHLPTTAKSSDGLHTITIKNMTLLVEEYTKDYFPFIFFRWYPHTPGFWGRGIAAEIANIYLQINKQLQMVDESFDLLGPATWFAERSSDVSEDALLSNEIGKLVEYTGTMPQLVVPNVVPEQLLNHIWQLEDRAYKIPGVSQANAAGQKEADGVTSAVGIREVQDIATGRFEVVAQRYEQVFIDLAKIIVDQAKDLYEQYPDLSVNLKEKRGITNIKFKDADVKNNPIDIQVFPVSGFAYSPAARMDQVMQYVQAGWLTREQGMSLLNFPDLEDTISLETATTTFVANAMSMMKEEDEYVAPLPELDLQLAFKLASLEIVRSTNEKVPTERILNIRNFKNACQDLLKKAAQQQALQQQAAPQPTPVMAPPQGPPMQMPPQG